MEYFTHGIIAINPKVVDENGDLQLLHFTGCWAEPSEDDIIFLWEELKKNEMFGLQSQIDEIELLVAPSEIVEYFNSITDWGDAINDDKIIYN